MMAVKGKNVVLTGEFRKLKRADGKEKLTKLGARVTDSVSSRAKRLHPMKDLAISAENAGHIGAVVSLLGRMPSTDFNDLPTTAFNAIWILATGQEVEPW